MRAAQATGGKLEVPTLEEQALYHNFCILGIIHPGLKHEGIELSRTAFRRSNNKALEYVLYRLYIIIEGKARAQKDFKGMLPVLDKLQQAPFYQRIGDWMAELKKSGRLEPSVILPVSALKTNTSNRLILLLLELSTVALHQDAEATCQGISQAAYLPPLGSSVAYMGGVGSGAGGLLDDPLVPGEVRLGVSTTRAKQACSEFLASTASASSICDAMEQRSLAFKKRYYELQAEIRQQHVAMAELPEGTLVTSSSQGPMTGSPASSGPNATPDSLQTGGAGALNALGACQQPPARRSPPRGLPNPEKAEALASLLAGLNEHLRVHKELSEALMTEGKDVDGSSASGGAAIAIGRTRAAGLAMDSTTGLRFGQSSSQQVLHPYQIDGRALATEALVAAATAAGPNPGARVGSSGLGFEHQSQRRQQKNMLMPYGPDNIVKAFMSFASLLSSLAPHVTQLAMAGENAGPPPLLQPPSHPSGHAAHVAHQLQVHGSSSRQIARLSRKVQEQSAAYGPALRALRLESSRAISHRCDFSNHDCLDVDFLDMGPHLALPPVLGNLVRQINAPLPSMASPTPHASAQPGGPGATGTSSGAPSVVVMGSPCPSSASAYGAAGSASGCASAGVAAHTATVVATSTTAAPADDGLAKIHARLRNLNIAQPTAAGVANTGFTGPSLGTAAPVSATSARANAAMSMFSPSANVQMTGASPKAMSGTAAGPARPPLSTTTQSAHDLPMYVPAVTGSTISPLRNVAEHQQHHGMHGSRHNMFMQPPNMNESGKEANGFTDAGCSMAWGQMPWLSGSDFSGAPGAPVAAAQASMVSQAWAAGFRWPSSSVAAPGWMSPQPSPQLQQLQQRSMNVQPDTAPPSRRGLDAPILQQPQQPRQQQHQQQHRAADAGGSLSVPSVDRRVSGVVSSSGGISRPMQRSDAEAFQSAETLVAETHRAALDGDSSAGPPPKLVCDVADGISSASAFGAGSNAGTFQPVAETGHRATSGSSGRWGPGENRRVDLCSLLDDDDEDKDGGHFLGGYRETRPFTGGLPDAPFDSSGAAAGITAPMGFSLPPSEGRQIGATANSSSQGVLHADNDADFGVLAAEGELVSQALMFGGSAANATASLNPHAAGLLPAVTGATVSGSVPATLFGAPMAEASGSAWGSCGGVAMMDVGDNEPERCPVGGGVSMMTAAHGGFGLTDIDSGDDIVMADNNKDASPGLSAKGLSAAGWLSAGWGAPQGGQAQKGNSLFDAFGALVSPQQQQLQQQGPANPSVTAPVVTAVSSGFGAEILALKARMQAAMTKQ